MTTLIYTHCACLDHRPGEHQLRVCDSATLRARISAEMLPALRRFSAELLIISAGGRVVSILEGGYSLEGLATGTAAHVRALMSR